MALGACIKTLTVRELVLTEYVTNGSIEADVKVLITGVDPYGGVGRLSHILGYELKGRSCSLAIPTATHGRKGIYLGGGGDQHVYIYRHVDTAGRWPRMYLFP